MNSVSTKLNHLNSQLLLFSYDVIFVILLFFFCYEFAYILPIVVFFCS